ncbi:MAG: hypothetical protein EOM68_01615 [Spirochaetia bacterium]|jgi:hypothetical protein|nr:hypothetical protein [Spirochaetia bacterium]
MKLNKYLQNMLYHWPAKMISLVFAICIYLFIQYSTTGARVVTIPLDVQLPSGYVAMSLVPESVEVAIRGNEDIIYLIDPNSIKASINFAFVQSEGIAIAPVVLLYEENVFISGSVSVSPTPSQYRVLFNREGGQ